MKSTADQFAGERTVPVCMAPHWAGGRILFTFSNDVLRLFLTNLERIRKPSEDATKYGFRGYSKGGKDGIFLLRKQDSGLRRAVDSYVARFQE